MAANTLRNLLLYPVLLLLLTLLFISSIPHTASACSGSETYEKYIQTACHSTLYRKLCRITLSPHALKIESNPLKLCKTALSISLKAVVNASTAVQKFPEHNGLTRYEAAVIKDCISNIKDSIDELQQSLDAMKDLSGPQKASQLANIKTWVSTALTDEYTCIDEFEEGPRTSTKAQEKIRMTILRIGKLTSNALALINNQLH
ncbi:21 kDa protein [Morella rubra]|uniref:21 kDa protein n=1 Tax=Morella rubra TaxID=262757 RepID=A0A6A1VIH8_9ROSI|nr:21 kDa protein [Morella rubra]